MNNTGQSKAKAAPPLIYILQDSTVKEGDQNNLISLMPELFKTRKPILVQCLQLLRKLSQICQLLFWKQEVQWPAPGFIISAGGQLLLGYGAVRNGGAEPP